ATVRSRDEYSKNILDFIPLRSARARLGTLKRAKLSRIRRELREKLRILKHGAPRRRIARKRRLLHLLGGSCPNQKIESGVRVRRASRDRDQPVAYFGTSLALCAGHYAEAHLAGDPRFCRIAERADPRGPVDRHRRRALKQVRRNLTRVEARVTRWRVLAQLEHEFQRVDAFRTINRWPSARVKHLRAERPEDRHEIGHRRVAPSRAHHVAVNSSVARRSCSLTLVDCFCRGQHIVPRRGRFEVVLFEKVFAIKEQLRIADVRQREQISVFIRMLTNRQRRADEVITRPRESPLLISRSEVRETILTRESREPRIIEHYQIVCAGPRAQ